MASPQDMDNILLTLGDIPHHATILLAWALLRHTLNPDEAATTVRKMGSIAVQLHVFKYLTSMLRALGSGENNVRSHFFLLLPVFYELLSM